MLGVRVVLGVGLAGVLVCFGCQSCVGLLFFGVSRLSLVVGLALVGVGFGVGAGFGVGSKSFVNLGLDLAIVFIANC